MSKPEQKPQPPEDDSTLDSPEVTSADDPTSDTEGYSSGVSKND